MASRRRLSSLVIGNLVACYHSGIMGDLDEKLDFLRAKGLAGVEHDSHVPFLEHLGGVRRLLVEWGARPALATAGLFHSIYGTEYFDAGIDGISRDEVRAVIGDEAEVIAWLWCMGRRDTIDGSARLVIHRQTGDPIALEERQVADLTELWVADMVEQVERLTVAERNSWSRLEELAPLASRAAREAFAAACARLE